MGPGIAQTLGKLPRAARDQFPTAIIVTEWWLMGSGGTYEGFVGCTPRRHL